MRDPVSSYGLQMAFTAALGSPFAVLVRAVVPLFTAPFDVPCKRLLFFLNGLMDVSYDTIKGLSIHFGMFF